MHLEVIRSAWPHSEVRSCSVGSSSGVRPKVIRLAGLHVCLLDLIKFFLTLLHGVFGRVDARFKFVQVVLVGRDSPAGSRPLAGAFATTEERANGVV